MADSFSANDVVRLALDGADNSTTIPDDLTHTFTANGTAKLKITTPTYGTASLLLDGTSNCCVSSNNHADWNMGSGDFCIDFFYKPTNVNLNTLVAISDGTTAAISVTQTVGNRFAVNVSIGATTYTALSQPNEIIPQHNTHIAAIRHGNLLKLFINGELETSTAITGSLDWNTNMKLVIGAAYTSVVSVEGYIDQFRVTKGAARYTVGGPPPVNSTFDAIDSAVTTTNLGTRTRQVSVYGTRNLDSIIAATTAAVIDLGWEYYDYRRGPTAITVFRCLNYDGTTYKFCVFFWDKARNKVIQTSCESWDITTKTMTNEVYSNYKSEGLHGISFTNTELILFGCNRYLGMMTYILTSPSIWSLCCEVEREAEEDTAAAGVPCWGMVYGGSFLTNEGTTSRYNWIRFPRTRDGATFELAAAYQTMVTNFGAFGGDTGFSLISLSARLNGHTSGTNGFFRTLNSAWASTKKVVSHVKFIKSLNISDSAMTVIGRMFGVKVCAPIGNTMERVTLPIDANMWADPAGTDTDHWILPTNVITNAIHSGIGGTLPTLVTHNLTGFGVCEYIAFTGQYVYSGTTLATGIVKTDISSSGSSVVAGTAVSSVYQDIVFDGRYIYGATTSGVTRVDTANSDAVATLAIGAGGINALGWNGGQFIYASQRTASTTPTVFKIDILTFTVVATIVMPVRIDTNIISGIATDGVDTIGLAWVGTTTTDNRYGMISVSTNAAKWSPPLPIAQAPDCAGISWAGDFWNVVEAFSAGGGFYVNHCVNGTASPPYGGISNYYGMTGLTFSILGSRRAGFERVGPYATMWVNSAAGSPTMWFANAADWAAGAAIANTTYAGLGGALGTRSLLHTGNQIISAMNGPTIYHMTNIHQRSYNGGAMANTLIPK